MIQMWDDIFVQYDKNIESDLVRGKGGDAFEKMHLLLDQTWAELYRVLSPGGYACINVGDATRSLDGDFRLYNNHSRIVSFCSSLGFCNLPNIIWNKPTNSPTKFMGSGMLPAGAYVTLEHEYILIFRKGRKRHFAATQKDLRAQSGLFWEERNTWYHDQWKVLGTKQSMTSASIRKRSAAFPLDIAYRLVNMFSIYGDTVLDPFAGTSTTTTSAVLTGRNSIAVDIDPDLISEGKKSFFKQGTKMNFNKIINQRLTRHLEFVDSKEELFFKYKNEIHSFPVKTRQEKRLTMYTIKSLSMSDEDVLVRYEAMKTNFQSGEKSKNSGQSGKVKSSTILKSKKKDRGLFS